MTLTRLTPPPSQRMAMQVMAAAFVIYAGFSAYFAVKPEAMTPISKYPDERLPDLPPWLFFLGIALAVVPGLFVFLHLQRGFRRVETTF